ncbi:MAG: 2-isopropylmalate synthase, partial [Candidatus Xenobia bacterium]
ARPADLAALVRVAAACKVSRFALSDSPGFATPSGVRALVAFVRQEGFTGSIGWTGMNDRGLALANALAALSCGVERIHASVLGLGEGAGWVALDLLLTNLAVMQTEQRDLRSLREYCHEVARICGAPIPINYPVLGADAFRTATGVHAAAILKARRKGDTWLADRVYSSIPAGLLGLSQTIDIGPMSGVSNVTCWLEGHGLSCTEEDVARILGLAKQSDRTLTEAEIRAVLGGVTEGVKDGSSARGR